MTKRSRPGAARPRRSICGWSRWPERHTLEPGLSSWLPRLLTTLGAAVELLTIPDLATWLAQSKNQLRSNAPGRQCMTSDGNCEGLDPGDLDALIFSAWLPRALGSSANPRPSGEQLRFAPGANSRGVRL